MRVVEGFQKAKPLLTREIPSYGLPLSSRLQKRATSKPSPEETVARILAEVKSKGDKALISYTKTLDGVEISSLEVSKNEITDAYNKVDKKLVSALELAANRIKKFHSMCKQRLESSFISQGLGRQISALNRVGIYVPGGTAAYPSTVLMSAIPASVATVKEIIMVTPPKKNGAVPPITLVAADIAKVDRIFKVGGAQAIAALAFGTESIPRVDKICGPGNIFVVTAKKMVYGTVAIESLPGPSEIIVVADDTANASFCAADLIAQAEHDPQASVILITTSPKLAKNVDREMKSQLANLERRTIAAESIKAKGMIIIVNNPNEAIELVNMYAPEHVSLMLRNAASYIQRIRNAGCIFIGGSSPVALGDYVAGPSHVLPTGGSARFSSPLGVEDFLKVTNVIALDKAAAKELGQVAITIAETEGLEGHAQAIRMRLNNRKEPK